MLRPLLYALLMWIVCIHALIKGGRSERLVALAIFIGGGLSPMILSPGDQQFQNVEIAVVILDLIMFGIFFGVALFERRNWPMWIAALQGVSLLGHFVILMPSGIPSVYHDAISLWSWPMLFILGRATLQRQRESRALTAANA